MSDEEQRRLFCTSTEVNFSVIAPAGVGKTFSIVERIATMAERTPERLADLYVISYTKKAAETLRQRCIDRLKTHPRYPDFAPKLQQSFFGTIHSLCWHHIQQLEPRNTYELLEDDTLLRQQFLEEISTEDPLYTCYKDLLQVVDIDTLLPIAEAIAPLPTYPESQQTPPTVDLSAIYNYPAEKRNRAAIAAAQRTVHAWEQDYLQEHYALYPLCTHGGESFKQTFYETFRPLYAYWGQRALALQQQLSQRYFQHRCQQGLLKHADFIFKAQLNLQTPQAQAFFAPKTLSIILDEAQDTDAHQLNYIRTLLQFNQRNQFSMVGDPQQAIYGSRVDVHDYLQFHEQVVKDGLCQPLVFSKTFRCPAAITQEINARFPQILNPAKDSAQVSYVPLVSTTNDTGRFAWIDVPPLPDGDEDKVAHEARCLSSFLHDYTQTISQDLSHICILCPRNEWLHELRQALTPYGWRLQLYSSTASVRSNALFCACLAFIHRINFPQESFEALGLLHEIFHHSEKFLTEHKEDFKRGNLEAQQILHDLREQILSRSLCAGMAIIVAFFQKHCSASETDPACLDLLMTQAFRTQSQQQSWAALEKRLQSLLTTSITLESDPIPGALQGYSCHKAKGLEWSTVILPFFYRPIRYKTLSYPYFFQNKILWHKYDSQASELQADRRRELQRLLYVSLTRAKHHLFIFQDKDLWSPAAASLSFGQLYTTD